MQVKATCSYCNNICYCCNKHVYFTPVPVNSDHPHEGVGGVLATSLRRRRLGHLGSCVVQARVRQSHGFTTVHDRGHPCGSSHECRVDAKLPLGLVATNSAAEAGKSVSNPNNRATASAQRAGPKDLSNMGAAGSLR